MTEAITEALKYSSIAAFLGLAQWVAVYTYLEPWWNNEVGRSLVVLAILDMCLPLLFILSLFFNLNRQTSIVVAWAVVVVFSLTALIMAQRSVIWVRKSREEAADPPETQ